MIRFYVPARRRVVQQEEGVMGDDAEYQMEQDELERKERDALRHARVDEDARRNRKWEQEAAAKAKAGVPSKPKDP